MTTTQRISLDQIAPDGATPGQIPTWDDTANSWVPATVESGSLETDYIEVTYDPDTDNIETVTEGFGEFERFTTFNWDLALRVLTSTVEVFKGVTRTTTYTYDTTGKITGTTTVES